MHQIRIESKKKPGVYRIVQVAASTTIFDLDTVLSTAFMIEEEEDVIYQSVQVNGRKNEQTIYLYSDELDEFESLEELVGDWFVKLGDEMLYISESGLRLKLILEQVTELDDLEPCVLDGQGDLFSKQKKVDLAELNAVLQLEMELEKSLFDNVAASMESLEPDYATLFQVADELKKLKPWHYFNNEDIVAIQLDGMKYFVSVMGAGGQEYGLMMYDEDFGYASLEKIINEEPLSDDFAMDLSALTVNYVDRDELDKDEYALIKEQGLSFRGKKNWISLRQFEPGFVPALPNYVAVEDMIALINAMIAITHMRMNGWEYPPVPINGYPLFDVSETEELEMLGILQMERIEQETVEIEINELELARVKKKKKSALELEFDYFYLPYAVEEGEHAIYPLMSVIANHVTGEIIGHEIIPFPKHPFIQQQFFWEMLKGMDVRPSKIFVTEETYARLKPVAELVGVELVVSDLPQLVEFKEMLRFMPPF